MKMDNKIVFLLIAIIALWVLINPTSRAWIKGLSSNALGTGAAAAPAVKSEGMDTPGSNGGWKGGDNISGGDTKIPSNIG